MSQWHENAVYGTSAPPNNTNNMDWTLVRQTIALYIGPSFIPAHQLCKFEPGSGKLYERMRQMCYTWIPHINSASLNLGPTHNVDECNICVTQRSLPHPQTSFVRVWTWLRHAIWTNANYVLHIDPSFSPAHQLSKFESGPDTQYETVRKMCYTWTLCRTCNGFFL